MKRIQLFWAIAALALTSCGPSAEKDLLGGAGGSGPEIEELNQNFPRTFRADVKYLDPIGTVLERSDYLSENPAAVFGCLDGADSFTFVMRTSDADRLRIKIEGIDVRQSRSRYENLVKVHLDGQSPQGGFLFDAAAAGSSMQVQYCDLVFQSAGTNMAGQLTCRNVTSQREGHPQADLQLNFNCQAQ